MSDYESNDLRSAAHRARMDPHGMADVEQPGQRDLEPVTEAEMAVLRRRGARLTQAEDFLPGRERSLAEVREDIRELSRAAFRLPPEAAA